MTSSEIRQSFLDFFKSKQHTIVPSSSLLPDSPNLLFTNAGMNQFVPIFLGQKKPDVSKWAGAVPRSDTRAADTQKCIRAGGKHNDLDDVGLDTYHHTFFEMLGNWSFGDYFKKEAIDWAWELVVNAWHFPPQRLYATVFCPYLGEPGWEAKWQQELEQVIVLAMTSPEFIAPDPNASPFQVADQEAAMYWAKKFSTVGLDPKTHIVPGNKKDNFWMMGETGPCGPCTEIHVDLTPEGNTRGSLVNKGDARCIEIWNNVFIQFNANPDGSFVPLPAKHVDTGMGFERVTSIIQGTKGLTDFKKAKISNYETDIFRPIFDAMEVIGGKVYGSTLPPADLTTINDRQKTDIAFRVIADHIRTLSFAIADGIEPSNEGRGYVLRRILRRAVRYGRSFGLRDPFFYQLVDVVADTMGDVFPEIRAKKKHVQDVIRTEEESFNQTLDRGIRLFEGEVSVAAFRAAAENEGYAVQTLFDSGSVLMGGDTTIETAPAYSLELTKNGKTHRLSPGDMKSNAWRKVLKSSPSISAADAFKLYDTYGFPLDLTELMARERGLTVDKEGFEKLMEEQRRKSREAHDLKKVVISVSQTEKTLPPTKFVGYELPEANAKVLDIIPVKEKTAIVFDTSPLYADMGGQVGDTGTFFDSKTSNGTTWKITGTQKSGNTWLHLVENDAGKPLPKVGSTVSVSFDGLRRAAIERHHTVTHILHHALRSILGKEVSQKGSFVGPEKLTFDFNSKPIPAQTLTDIEKFVNDYILLNHAVSWVEVPYNEIKGRDDVMQFFGEKYGDKVRVVQIGGRPQKLDGFSMELCGGTHTRATGEIGMFRIVSEAAIQSGVRRIEAIAGLESYRKAIDELSLIKSIADKVNSPIHELEKKIESMLAHQKALEKEVQMAMQRNASNAASELLGSAQTVNGVPVITHNLGDANGDFLQAIADSLKGRFKGVVVLGGGSESAVSLVATVSPEFTAKVQAGRLIQGIAPIVGGKGGGKPDNARGGGKDAGKLDEALAKAKSLLG